MKFGLLSDQRRIKFGYGLRLTGIREKLPEHAAGSRDKEGARGLWNSLSESCRKNAVFYSDCWSAYKALFLRADIFLSGRKAERQTILNGLTLTLRQRVSRLGRKNLSFSKNMRNHIGAIWNFIHHYNENIAPNLSTTS